MNFGVPVSEERYMALIRQAYDLGIRTFVTADVYALGEADKWFGRALEGIPRDSYCLVGIVGHDFYTGERDGQKGYPRFTNPQLRKPEQYASFLREATEKSLGRCQTSRFDIVLLHNPDSIGYTHDAVWNGMSALKDAGLTERIGVAPGPANGFVLDMLFCFERFGALIDTAMIILNPMEPWPGSYVLAGAEQQGIEIMARVVDYGGIFHDDVKPQHVFGERDHRAFRPAGWVEQGNEKLERMRPYAERHGLTPLQLACAWNLSQRPVVSVVPTLIEESAENPAKPIEAKLRELAALPDVQLSAEEVAELRAIGDNKGCMDLKGGNPQYVGEPMADRWSLTPELHAVAKRWGIDPSADLVLAHSVA
jgi:aryl-alcohol dehydrogenase-like predicted oxidoreductase